jgi:hypothetical protein
VRADVNGDGHPDWLAAVSPTQGRHTHAKLVLAAGSGKGGFKPLAESQPFPYASSPGSSWIEDVSVLGRNRFEVQFNDKTCGGVAATRVQFERGIRGWRATRVTQTGAECGDRRGVDRQVDLVRGKATIVHYVPDRRGGPPVGQSVQRHMLPAAVPLAECDYFELVRQIDAALR